MKYVKLFEEFEEFEPEGGYVGYRGYKKEFDQPYSFQNDFKKTNKEAMMNTHGENLPKELYNIISEFSGKHYSFGITKDQGELPYKVYKWRSIFELEEIGEFVTEDDAEALVKKVKDLS
jgi:hypothetical protein